MSIIADYPASVPLRFEVRNYEDKAVLYSTLVPDDGMVNGTFTPTQTKGYFISITANNTTENPIAITVDNFYAYTKPINPSDYISLFKPDVVAYNDYFPFGSLVPNRHGNSQSYRYGFQGQEKDDEIKGEGNSYTTHFRLLDPRVGRWFTKDPKSSKYPFHSPYSSFGNNPLNFVDMKGDTLRVGGNIRVAYDDIKKFVPSNYQNLISFGKGRTASITSPDGDVSVVQIMPAEVIFNITSQQAYASKDPGVIALYEMTNSDKEMYYGVQNSIHVGDFDGTYGKINSSRGLSDDGITGAKSTPRSFDRNGNPLGYKSISGIDGLRTIAEGVWEEQDSGGNVSTKSRESLVFHELFELFEEVINNEYYNQSIARNKGVYNNEKIELNNNGSHNLSKKAEVSLPAGDARKSNSPGEVSKFTPKSRAND